MPQMLRNRCGKGVWGSAKNGVIFPIASLCCPKMIALVKSEHAYVCSNIHRINILGAQGDNVASDSGGFYLFCDKTTHQKWPVSTQSIFAKSLILSIS
jgi:hypothetical protein